MNSDEIAYKIRNDALSNTGIWWGAILTVANVSDFDIRMPDGTEANVRIEVKS